MALRALKARNGRASRLDLANFVQALPSPEKTLGLTHITSSYSLRDIVETGSIFATEPCDVIGERVIYAFYGRAAFRRSSESEPTSLPSLCPCVLVVDPDKIPKPRYVFGFDSGAFVNGMMDQYLHPHMPLFDFMLIPDIQSAARLVNAIFASTEDFFRNRPTISLSSPPSSFEIDSYLKIVRSSGASTPALDDRASTPELIFADALRLRDCVRAAIVPDSLSSDPLIGGKLRDAGIKVLDYLWTSGSRPMEYHFIVRNLVQDCYKSFGWM